MALRVKSQKNYVVVVMMGSASAASLAVATPALAQQATPAASNNTGDIVVTAQRREEKLSRVAVAIQAFNADTLKSKVIVSEQDMGTLVPGLQVKNGQTSNQLSYSMRGQTLDPFSGTSPAVLTYLNDAPYNPYNTATSFFDLGGVQVLKGPQGTLFGRNATGGAVLYSSPMPGNELSGNLIVRGGQRNSIQVQGALDIPLVKDVLLVRVAGDFTKQDGYIHNVNTGNTLGDSDNKSGRITILFKPADGIKNTTIVQYSHFGGTDGAGNLYNYYTTPNASGQQYINNGVTSVLNTTGSPLTSTLDTVYNTYSSALFNKSGCPLGDSSAPGQPAGCTNVASPGRFPGGVAGYAAWSRAHPYDTWLQFDTPHTAHTTFVSNATEVQVADNMKIKNIFSYMNSASVETSNLAGGPFGALWLYNDPNNATGLSGNGGPGGEHYDASQFSDELQAQGKALGGQLNYTFGAFYSHHKHTDLTPIIVGSEIDPTKGAAAAFGLPADIDYHATEKDISKAIYAQVDYAITDKLKATLGGRYTWESVSMNQDAGSLFVIMGLTNTSTVQTKNLSAPSWTFNLQYQLDPNNMFYFAQRGSFRSGNWNSTVTVANNDNYFDTEYAHDFELGYKFSGKLGVMPTHFNVAAYEEIVKHAQHAIYAVVGGQPAGFTVNVPSAKSTGVEVDGSIGLTSWLNLSAIASYTNARYTQGLTDVHGLAQVDFNSYPDSPRWSETVAADVTLPVSADVGKVLLHGEVYSQTHTYFSSNNGSVTPGTELGGYTNVNMRLSWNDIMQSKVSAGVYVKNLMNKLYYVSGFAMGAAGGYNTAYPGAPRTVAAEISVKF